MRRISFRLGRRRDSSLPLRRRRRQRKMHRRVMVRERRKRRIADRKVRRNRLLTLRKVVSLALKRANQRRKPTMMDSASPTNPARHYLLSTNHKAAQLNPHPSKLRQSTQLFSTRVTLSLLRNLQSHKAILLRDRPPVPLHLHCQPFPPLQPLQARTLSPLRADLPPLQPTLSLEMIFLPISFILYIIEC